MAKRNALPPPQQKPATTTLPLEAGSLSSVIGGGVEVGGDLVGRELADGFGDRPVGKALVRPPLAPCRRADRARWRCSRLRPVGRPVLRPVGEAEDFVNDEDYRTLVLRFGIDDEGVHIAAVVLYGDPFAVARRFFDAFPRPRLRPFLRGDCLRGQQHTQQDER